MAAIPEHMTYAVGLREIRDFCRKCKGNLTGRDIQEVAAAEWCCPCLSKLANNHTHLCEYDFAGSKQHCVHCAGCHYSHTKPCLGPPEGDEKAQTAARNLVKNAKDLCSAEWKFLEFAHKARVLRESIDEQYKKNSSKEEYRGKMREQELVIDALHVAFKKAADNWKAVEKHNGGAINMAKQRFDNDKERLGPESTKIFEKSPAQHQSNDTEDATLIVLRELGNAEVAIDNALACAFERGGSGNTVFSQDDSQAILRRMKHISDAQSLFLHLLQTRQ